MFHPNITNCVRSLSLPKHVLHVQSQEVDTWETTILSSSYSLLVEVSIIIFVESYINHVLYYSPITIIIVAVLATTRIAEKCSPTLATVLLLLSLAS